MAIRYRRSESGATPYAIRYINVGPCPNDMEESERLLTDEQYRQSNNWRWNWRVR